MFHWRDGIHFERLENGDVKVFNPNFNISVVIPFAEWISIIVSVTKEGVESGAKYDEGKKFHGIE